MFLRLYISAVLISICTLTSFAQQKVDNVVLITLDGLRWQELFGGAADSMLVNKDLLKYKYLNDSLQKKFLHKSKIKNRASLMPFFWNTIAKEGVIYGNRWEKNKVNLTNRFWFSYPGYNEILTGFSDPEVDSNKKKYNKNKTILEILNENPEYAGRVAAFGSWDVFPYIINDKRSKVPVNAGFRKAEGELLTTTEQLLNKMQDEVSGPWDGVRLDAFTHNYMIEYMKKNHPRVVYISYGETDDFAHDGKYDQYLISAHKTDQWIKALWNYIQSDPFYAGKTSLVITTDHGRGDSPMTEWKSHGTIYKGSNAIWIAAIGPNVKALGEVKSDDQLYQNQVAATVMKMLGFDYSGGRYDAGKPIMSMIKN